MPGEQRFDEFYAAVFGRLVGQLYLVTGDLHDAEDVVQEALTRAAALDATGAAIGNWTVGRCG